MLLWLCLVVSFVTLWFRIDETRRPGVLMRYAVVPGLTLALLFGVCGSAVGQNAALRTVRRRSG